MREFLKDKPKAEEAEGVCPDCGGTLHEKCPEWQEYAEEAYGGSAWEEAEMEETENAESLEEVRRDLKERCQLAMGHLQEILAGVETAPIEQVERNLDLLLEMLEMLEGGLERVIEVPRVS